MKVIDLTAHRAATEPPSAVEALKRLLADIEEGREPVPRRIVLVAASDDDYSLYAAGTNELEEIGLAGLGLCMLVGVATGGGAGDGA